MNPIKTILHPTDFSEHSHYALWLAALIARAQGARLLIMHVVPSTLPVTGPGEVRALEKAERYQRDLKSYQEEMKARLRRLEVPDSSVRPEFLFEEGDVARSILATAQARLCDLIVMGSHGLSASRQAILGSVAEEVGRKAACPVLTVKLPAPQVRLSTTSIPQEAEMVH